MSLSPWACHFVGTPFNCPSEQGEGKGCALRKGRVTLTLALSHQGRGDITASTTRWGLGYAVGGVGVKIRGCVVWVFRVCCIEISRFS